MRYRAAIVVPLLRQVDAWLDHSLRSALRQSAPTEVIVVRSEKTPPSNLQILSDLQKHFANLSVLVEDLPGSFPGAINKGIRHAAAERVGFLLSDDWLDAHAVAESLPHDADIVSTGNALYFPDGRINDRGCRNRSMDQFNALRTLEQRASYLSHFFLFRKQSILDAGGLDESIGNFPGIDDFDLVWTLLERRASVSIVEKQLYHMRDHDGERLTLQDSAVATKNLKAILFKHGVTDHDAADIVARHARWFGQPIYRVLDASK